MSFGEFCSWLDDFAWGYWLIILLLGTGVVYTIMTKGIQFRKFVYSLRVTIGKMFIQDRSKRGEVSPFQAVATALAATVGTGNIVGVALAILVGGPGAVFWLWVSGIFGMAVKYGEVVLAVNFRERNEHGDWVGGPMYYIENGLGKKYIWLAIIFSVLAAIAAFGIGAATQTKSVCDAIVNVINNFGGNTAAGAITILGSETTVANLVIGTLVAIVIGVVLFGGIKRIGQVSETIIPFMAALYIICAIITIFRNVAYIGPAFAIIFKGAFSPSAAVGAGAGILFKVTIQKGIARGLFSNEAGLGSAPMAHAATSEKEPVKQGMFGIFEVFVDTIVICTLTGLTVIVSRLSGTIDFEWGAGISSTNVATMISTAFASVFGMKIASIIVGVCLTLFAFSTAMTWSLYGSRCFEYVFTTKFSYVYKFVYLFMCVGGATLALGDVWNLTEAFQGFMAVPNLIALIFLSPVVVKLTNEYFAKSHWYSKAEKQD